MPEGEKKTWRERYAQARENMKNNKTVQWVQDNKVPIGVGVVGGITMGYFLHSSNVKPLLDNRPSNTAGLLINSSQTITNTVTQQNNFGGHCCKILQDAADPSKLWPKIKDFCEQVAEENNTTPDKVYRLLKRYWQGDLANVYGYCPLRYGVTTTG